MDIDWMGVFEKFKAGDLCPLLFPKVRVFSELRLVNEKSV